ncbi:hypothetical protein GLOIN_2v1559552 [Rhizophagus irregularis DAOM 181602=DAOM 197198]|uniref:Uncharacterized protein n=1 Tax=Rhizophagus irregularis (strain DAOM 181602 / DAOM 197198 / MUCL 43194) TaxID=747089 RepID=A0A2P4QEK7_RHIID|nr:hypothetical protein GLOIN_2v1559552 [Rhizophagus irregularis DAOM 181602=DAOM 197198]POG76047.1 hypothetical protein GLOIN_2v1559552 [Rhizophagus irregularis DAOM 181602=DAOM 197198]|eukprot:XP_025182913.1 hypothetical protein GLOIN_2v1559552 [Rhizophagus irregularis DAOM 181602=DAOM 197198]
MRLTMKVVIIYFFVHFVYSEPFLYISYIFYRHSFMCISETFLFYRLLKIESSFSQKKYSPGITRRVYLFGKDLFF